MVLEYLLLILAYLTAAWNGGATLLPSSPGWALASVFAAAALSVVLALGTARSLAGRMASWKGDWGVLVNQYARTLTLLRISHLALFAGAVHAGGFGGFVRADLGLGAVPLVREAVLLLPFAATWFASTWILFQLEGGEGDRGTYLAFRARSSLGMLGLLLVLGGAAEAVFGSDSVVALFRETPWLELPVAAVVLGAGLLAVPLGLRVIWTTRPLPEGSLKRALEAFSAGAGFRYSSIRIWETGGLSILNAAVAGLVPRFRTVFFTRGLLENLEEEEVLSVFAHEVGHVKRRHAWIGLSLAFAWAGFVLGLDGGALDPGSAAVARGAQGGVTLVFAVLYVALSRRLESDADLYALDTIGDPDRIAETLLRVAMLNGDTRSMRSITHASVESRVALLKRAASDAGERDRCRGSVGRLTLLSAVLSAGGLASALPRFFG